MIKAVIFDLDDTLISEKEYIESGYKQIASLLSKKYGQPVHELYQLMLKLLMENSSNVFNRLLDQVGINYTKKEVLELVEEYRNHFPTIKFFEDVLPCIRMLREKGIKIGIITDGYMHAQRQKLKAVHAAKYFDEIIITDELGRDFWKPHPKAFEIMRERLNLEYNQMVYIGDNPKKDFYISKTYPIKTVRINRQGIYENHPYLEDIKENHSISNLNEIMALIF